MHGRNVPVTVFVLMMFALAPAIHAMTPEAGPPGSPSGRMDISRTPWTGTLRLAGSYYSCSTFNISLPNNATVQSASMDIEGQPVVGPLQSLSCDFANDPDNKYSAIAGGYSKSSPGNAKPTTFNQGNMFAGQDLTAISYSDNSFATVYWAYMSGGSGEYGFHLFSFQVSLDITSKVSVTYQGYGGYPGYYYGVGTVAAYLWNNASQSWESVGSGSDNPESLLSRDFTGSGYIATQGARHYVYVLAMCPVGTGWGGYWYYNCVNTDYVKVDVQGNALSWPKNPKMFIGPTPSNPAGNVPVWNYDVDVFNTIMSIADVTISNALGAMAAKTTTQFSDIKIKFQSETAGIIRVSNITVSIKAPPWCKSVPDFNVTEDTPDPKVINLNSWFVSYSGDKLQFITTFKSDAKKLDATIDVDGWMGFKMPTKYWWGDQQFKVKATDSDGLERESNLFTVHILWVNAPPFITPAGRQVATQGVPFTLQVRAKDPDQLLDPTETLTFSDNTPLFEIDPTTGKISFTPTQDQVGFYTLTIIVTDRDGAVASMNFSLEVQDAEDPPVLDPISELTANQDQPFSYTVTAQDPDLPYGDSLMFGDDSPLFQINETTGLIEFIPTVKDIGAHKVTVTVTDSHGASDSKQFTLDVLNSMGTMNRPPSVDPMPNQTAYEGVPFLYAVNATDPDLGAGDSLAFSDNCPVFDINPSTGKISFTPKAKDAGIYNVKITVKDHEGLYATAEFRLTVIKANHAPVVLQVLPKDGTKVLINRGFLLSASASDIDGDKLNYTWKDGDNILGFGANITARFSEPGDYIITLVVSDGQLEKVNETTVTVVERLGGGGSNKSPGFETVIAAGALMAAVVLVAFRKRR